jgi:hypothetical protein
MDRPKYKEWYTEPKATFLRPLYLKTITTSVRFSHIIPTIYSFVLSEIGSRSSLQTQNVYITAGRREVIKRINLINKYYPV